LPWSGNNNQIYKTLVELLDEGFLTNEVRHQESSPSKKIYTITEAGLAELRRLGGAEPEPPEFRNLFLVQLAWASELSDAEVAALIDKYEAELDAQLHLHEEQHRRDGVAPRRNAREVVVWNAIHENVMDFYRNERRWVERLKEALAHIPKEGEEG
jgi:DNA-binding PadR family transcriptional regulator